MADVAGVRVNVAVTPVAATALLDNVTEAAYIEGNIPVKVVSMMVGLPADKSMEVPAAMVANAACPAVGVVNFVTATVTTVAALKVPAVSFTVNTEPADTAEHAGDPELGAVTAQRVSHNITIDFTVTFTFSHTGWGCYVTNFGLLAGVCYVTSPAKGAGDVT